MEVIGSTWAPRWFLTWDAMPWNTFRIVGLLWGQSTGYSRIHPFIHPLIHSFTHSLTHSVIHSPFHLLSDFHVHLWYSLPYITAYPTSPCSPGGIENMNTSARTAKNDATPYNWAFLSLPIAECVTRHVVLVLQRKETRDPGRPGTSPHCTVVPSSLPVAGWDIKLNGVVREGHSMVDCHIYRL